MQSETLTGVEQNEVDKMRSSGFLFLPDDVRHAPGKLRFGGSFMGKAIFPAVILARNHKIMYFCTQQNDTQRTRGLICKSEVCVAVLPPF